MSQHTHMHTNKCTPGQQSGANTVVMDLAQGTKVSNSGTYKKYIYCTQILYILRV